MNPEVWKFFTVIGVAALLFNIGHLLSKRRPLPHRQRHPWEMWYARLDIIGAFLFTIGACLAWKEAPELLSIPVISVGLIVYCCAVLLWGFWYFGPRKQCKP